MDWIGVDLEVSRQRGKEKKGCVFDHQRLLLSQTSRHTNTHLSLHLPEEFARGHREGGGQMGLD